jgi:hypothetical protein
MSQHLSACSGSLYNGRDQRGTVRCWVDIRSGMLEAALRLDDTSALTVHSDSK